MTQNANNCEGHTGTVAESVSDEYLGWESVVLEESQGAHQEWDHESKGEHVVLDCLSWISGVKSLIKIDFNDIMDDDEAADNDCLANLDSINTSVNVDSIGTENSDISHVNIVDDAKVDVSSQNGSENFWHNDWGNTLIGNKKWEWSDCWHNNFMSPFKINNIINESKHNNHANSE